MDTKQARAVYVAQQCAVQMQNLKAIDIALQDLLAQYTNEVMSTTWQNMATAIYQTDGSIGAADGSPNTAHPITVGSIFRSQTQLVAVMTLATDLHNFLNNAAVSTANRIQTVNDMVSQ